MEDVYKDVFITLEPGDCLLVYGEGIIGEANESAGEKYGEPRLIENYLKNIDLSSREIVRSIAETVYEFIN